jgi:hypothetical protein
MGLWTSLAVLSLLSFLSSGFIAQHRIAAGESQPAPAAPEWRTDLGAAVGGRPLRYKYWAPGEVEGGAPTSLWFTTENTVVATFVIGTKGKGAVLSRPDEPSTEPFRLRAIFLNATTGKITAGAEWPSESRNSLAVAVRNGDLVIQAGRRISLYRPGSRDAGGLVELPATGVDDWYAHASPTGENIFFIASNLATKSAVPWAWVKTRPLRVVRSWNEVQSGWVGISDSAVAMTECVWFQACKPEIEVRSFSGGWKTIAAASREDEPQPRFAREGVLLLARRTMRVLRATDGEVIFSGGGPLKGGWWGTPIISAGGAHFVCLGWRQEGAHPALDIDGHSVLRRLLVYDLPPLDHAQVLVVKGPKIEDVYDPRDVALSPDGSRLAILSKHVVYMFDLPRQPGEGTAAAPRKP